MEKQSRYCNCVQQPNDNESFLKSCFGYQGSAINRGEAGDECLECGLFERCYKVSINVSLRQIHHQLRPLSAMRASLIDIVNITMKK